MTDRSATVQKAERVSRLLRSLVGVVDLRVEWQPEARLRQLHVLRDPAVQDHQIVRNAVSALEAGLGIRLPIAAVRVYADEAAFFAAVAPLDLIAAAAAAVAEELALAEEEAVVVEEPAEQFVLAGVAAEAEACTPQVTLRLQELAVPVVAAVASRVGNGNGAYTNGNGHKNGNGHHTNGNGHHTNGHGHSNGANGNGAHTPGGANGGILGEQVHAFAGAAIPVTVGVNGSAVAAKRVAAPEGAPRLELVCMTRQGGTLRCKVTVAVNGSTWSASANAPDSPTAEAELAARVTLDALRAGRQTSARLDRIEYATISGASYVVAALREPTSSVPRTSAAPLMADLARSAAEAVLAAATPG